MNQVTTELKLEQLQKITMYNDFLNRLNVDDFDRSETFVAVTNAFKATIGLE